MRFLVHFRGIAAWVRPQSPVVRVINWFSPKTGGVVLFNQIHLRGTLAGRIAQFGPGIREPLGVFLAHELCHIAQQRRIGRVRFYGVWLWQVLSRWLRAPHKPRAAYKGAPLEVEADRFGAAYGPDLAHEYLDGWMELERRALSRPV